MLTVRDHMRLTMADQNRGPWFTRAGRVRDLLGESETASQAAPGIDAAAREAVSSSTCV